jgi:methionyl aminopeptidase
MIIYKSPDELQRMRKAGRITAGTIDRVLAAVAPGKTTADLDAVAEAYIRGPRPRSRATAGSPPPSAPR